MLRKALFMSICLISISGCALTRDSDVEVQNQDTANSATNADVQPAVNEAATAAASQTDNQSAAGISADDVTRIQAYLRKVGFYAGSVNGVVDENTRAAMQHLQAACLGLKDLIPIADGAASKSKGQTTAKNKSSGATTIRLVQVRLKDAGFDPGPIDGINGVRTRSALSALKSGCMMIKKNIATPPVEQAHAPTGDGASNQAPLNRRIQDTINQASEDCDQESNPSSRKAIIALQVRLRDAGFNPGPIDGILGPRTKIAAQNYQSSLH